MKFILKILILLFLFSCTNKKPIKVFNFQNYEKYIKIKLYADSTYIEEYKFLERSFSIEGKWQSNIIDKDTFLLLSTNSGTSKYIIKNDKAVFLNFESNETKKLVK